LRHYPTRKGADFPLVLAHENRQPTGAGSDADRSAGPQWPSLVLLPPPTHFGSRLCRSIVQVALKANAGDRVP